MPLGAMPDLTTAGGQTFALGLPGQIVDATETVTDSGINDRTVVMTIGTADATAAGLYGAGTLTTKVLSLNVNGQGLSGLTLAAGGNVATLAAFLTAIKAKTEWAGVNAQIGGPNANQIVLSAATSLVVDVNGTSTANAVLGLTAGAKTAQAVASIDFGVAVVKSNLDGRVSVPLLDDDVISGISVRNTFARAADANGNIDYAKSYAVPFLKFGYIWAVAAETGKAGDQVISLTQGNSYTGGLWNSAVIPGALGCVTAGAAGYGRVSLTGATWETTPVQGTLGKIRIVK